MAKPERFFIWHFSFFSDLPAQLLNLFEHFHFLGGISCFIVAGGISTADLRSYTAEVMIGDLGTKKLPNVPRNIQASSLVLHNGHILLCGGGGQGNDKECLELHHGTWRRQYSALNQRRYEHSGVPTQTATFLFGGFHSSNTYEYLPKDSNTWLMGKTKIPGGFCFGSAISVKSEQEIWLIGGESTGKRILSFSIKDHTFQELPFKLKQRRYLPKCTFIPNTSKIMITCNNLNTTDILDAKNGSIITRPIHSSKSFYCLGTVTINDKDRLHSDHHLSGRWK